MFRGWGEHGRGVAAEARTTRCRAAGLRSTTNVVPTAATRLRAASVRSRTAPSFQTRGVIATWQIPTSPDIGGVSADGAHSR